MGFDTLTENDTYHLVLYVGELVLQNLSFSLKLSKLQVLELFTKFVENEFRWNYEITPAGCNYFYSENGKKAWSEEYPIGLWKKGYLKPVKHVISDDHNIKLAEFYSDVIASIFEVAQNRAWIYEMTEEDKKFPEQAAWAFYDWYSKPNIQTEFKQAFWRWDERRRRDVKKLIKYQNKIKKGYICR